MIGLGKSLIWFVIAPYVMSSSPIIALRLSADALVGAQFAYGNTDARRMALSDTVYPELLEYCMGRSASHKGACRQRKLHSVDNRHGK